MDETSDNGISITMLKAAEIGVVYLSLFAILFVDILVVDGRRFASRSESYLLTADIVMSGGVSMGF